MKKQTKAKKANGFFEKQTKAKKADNDNVTVNVSEYVNKNENDIVNVSEYVCENKTDKLLQKAY